MHCKNTLKSFFFPLKLKKVKAYAKNSKPDLYVHGYLECEMPLVLLICSQLWEEFKKLKNKEKFFHLLTFPINTININKWQKNNKWEQWRLFIFIQFCDI